MTQTAQKKNCSKVSFTSGHRPTLTAFSSGTTSLMFKLNYPTFSPHSLFPWLSGLQVPRPVQPCVPGTEVTHFGSVPRDVKAVRACRGMTRQGGRPRQGISRHTYQAPLAPEEILLFGLRGERGTSVGSRLGHHRRLHSPLSVHTFTAWATWRLTASYRSGIHLYKIAIS